MRLGKIPFRVFTTSIYSTDWDINESKRKVSPRMVPSWDTKLSKNAYYIYYLWKGSVPWQFHISVRFCSKLLKFFMQASLAETWGWAKFQIKIQKYSFSAKVGFYWKNSLKTRYHTGNMPGARTFFMVDIAHWGLQVAQSPNSKANVHPGMFPRELWQFIP
jgi:hypothetical protein